MAQGLVIHILLPVHNRLHIVKRFIHCLQAQTGVRYHLILIDDGSTDGTPDYVKSQIKDLTVLTGRGDWWWGGSLHQGYGWLKANKVNAGDFVLMVNNDTEFGEDFLQKSTEVLSEHHKTLLLPEVYSRQSSKLIETGVFADWHRFTFENTEDRGKINCLTTRALFLRVGDLMDIGGFHPVLLPHYLSDHEFTIRAFQKGYQLRVDPALKITVDESTTGPHALCRGTGRAEFFKEYFSKRSPGNPVYWFSFVALACPWGLKPLNFFRVIYGGLAVVLRKISGIYNNKWR